MGFSNSKRLVACMLLMAVVASAVDQPVNDSPSAVSDAFVCTGECLESRLASLEEQVQSMQTTCCIKEHCLIDLASYGFDDSKKYGYVRTSGGSSDETYTPVQIDRYRGVTIFELDFITCTTRNRQRFDTHALTEDRTKLVKTLEAATVGTIIVGVTADSAEEKTGFQTVARSFFSSYNMSLSGLQLRDKFAFILQKGYPKKTVFERKPRYGDSLKMTIVLQGWTVQDVSFEKV